MTTYYPSQAASAYGAQPQMMYQQPGYVQTASYGVPQSSYGMPATGVVGVPMSQPTVMMQQQQPMAYSYAQPQYYGQPKWTLSQRIRLFFGLAPTPAFKYRSEKNTWGFMGYSRRQRYIDPRTGQEVDRDGRPVLRM